MVFLFSHPSGRYAKEPKILENFHLFWEPCHTQGGNVGISPSPLFYHEINFIVPKQYMTIRQFQTFWNLILANFRICKDSPKSKFQAHNNCQIGSSWNFDFDIIHLSKKLNRGKFLNFHTVPIPSAGGVPFICTHFLLFLAVVK